jgi:hypothetical protein
MENVEGSAPERKQAAKEAIRSGKVEVLFQIIYELEGMNLSAKEIQSIFKTCGLNNDYAIRMGVLISDKKRQRLSSSW